MRNPRFSALALLLGLAVLTATAARVQAGDTVPAKTYTGYFVKNTHRFPPGKNYECLYIEDKGTFDSLFGIGAVMGGKQEWLPNNFFSHNAVIAVIRNGLWDLRLDRVSARNGTVSFQYSADRKKASYEAVTPLIVAVPKNIGHNVEFVENGKVIDRIGSRPGPAGPPAPQAPLAGGWGNYQKVDREAREVFNRAVAGLTGAGYEPLLYSQQVVAGTNYRFVCLQTTTTHPPAYGVAVVSFWQELGGKISNLAVRKIDL